MDMQLHLLHARCTDACMEGAHALRSQHPLWLKHSIVPVLAYYECSVTHVQLQVKGTTSHVVRLLSSVNANYGNVGEAFGAYVNARRAALKASKQ